MPGSAKARAVCARFGYFNFFNSKCAQHTAIVLLLVKPCLASLDTLTVNRSPLSSRPLIPIIPVTAHSTPAICNLRVLGRSAILQCQPAHQHKLKASFDKSYFQTIKAQISSSCPGLSSAVRPAGCLIHICAGHIVFQSGSVISGVSLPMNTSQGLSSLLCISGNAIVEFRATQLTSNVGHARVMKYRDSLLGRMECTPGPPSGPDPPSGPPSGPDPPSGPPSGPGPSSPSKLPQQAYEDAADDIGALQYSLMYVQDAARLLLSHNTQLTNNTGLSAVVATGSSSVLVSNTTFSSNVGLSKGAAIVLQGDAHLAVQSSTFHKNVVHGRFCMGGAIWSSSIGNIIFTADLNLEQHDATPTGVAFTSNGAIGPGCGAGAMHLQRNAVAPVPPHDDSLQVASRSNSTQGGDIAASALAPIMISSALFSRNRADGENAMAGALWLEGPGAVLHAHDSSFDGNEAMGWPTAGTGGAVLVRSRAALHASGCAFTHNIALKGGAIAATNDRKQRPPPAPPDTPVKPPSTLDQAPSQGQPTTSIHLEDSWLTGNKALGPLSQGGAIWAAGADIQAVGCLLADNGAEIGAGVSLVMQGALRAHNTTFRDNGAVIQGGACYGSAGLGDVVELQFTNSKILNNRASSGNGGAICGHQGPAPFGGNWLHVDLFSGTVLDNNTASLGSGGAVYMQGGRLQLDDGVVLCNNKAYEKGGAVAIMRVGGMKGPGRNKRALQLCEPRAPPKRQHEATRASLKLVGQGGINVTGNYACRQGGGMFIDEEVHGWREVYRRLEAAAHNNYASACEQIAFPGKCPRGQILDPNVGTCLRCPVNTYWMNGSHPTAAATCEPCPAGGFCPGGDQLLSKPGFYGSPLQNVTPCPNPYACESSLSESDPFPRSYANFCKVEPRHVYTYTHMPDSIPGDDRLDEAPDGCAQGYKGMLCGVCEGGYNQKVPFSCVACPDSPLTARVRLGIAALVVSALVHLQWSSAWLGNSHGDVSFESSDVLKVLVWFFQAIVIVHGYLASSHLNAGSLQATGRITDFLSTIFTAGGFGSFASVYCAMGDRAANSSFDWAYKRAVITLVLPVLLIVAVTVLHVLLRLAVAPLLNSLAPDWSSSSGIAARPWSRRSRRGCGCCSGGAGGWSDSAQCMSQLSTALLYLSGRALGVDKPMLGARLLAAPWSVVRQPGTFAYDLVQRLPLLAVVCLQWCFPSLLRVSWGWLVCVPVDGTPHWVFAMQQTCWQGTHLKWAASLGSIMIGLFAVGVPLAAFVGGRRRVKASAAKQWSSSTTPISPALPTTLPAPPLVLSPAAAAPPEESASADPQQQQQQQQQQRSISPTSELSLGGWQPRKAPVKRSTRDQDSPTSSSDNTALSTSFSFNPAQGQVSLDSAYDSIRAAHLCNGSDVGTVHHDGPSTLAPAPLTGSGNGSEGMMGRRTLLHSPDTSAASTNAGSGHVITPLSRGSSGAASDVSLLPPAVMTSDDVLLSASAAAGGAAPSASMRAAADSSSRAPGGPLAAHQRGAVNHWLPSIPSWTAAPAAGVGGAGGNRVQGGRPAEKCVMHEARAAAVGPQSLTGGPDVVLTMQQQQQGQGVAGGAGGGGVCHAGYLTPGLSAMNRFLYKTYRPNQAHCEGLITFFRLVLLLLVASYAPVMQQPFFGLVALGVTFTAFLLLQVIVKPYQDLAFDHLQRICYGVLLVNATGCTIIAVGSHQPPPSDSKLGGAVALGVLMMAANVLFFGWAVLLMFGALMATHVHKQQGTGGVGTAGAHGVLPGQQMAMRTGGGWWVLTFVLPWRSAQSSTKSTVAVPISHGGAWQQAV